METEKILKSFMVIDENQAFPYEQMRQAVAAREEIIPDLLAVLDYIYENAESLYENDDPYALHLYAMFLLAQFREKRAFPKLIKMLTLDNDYVDSLLGDTVTEDYPKFLYSTYDGQLNLLHEIIERVDSDVFTRTCALRVCDKLFEKGEIDRGEHIDYLRLLANRYGGEDSGVLGATIADTVANLKITELMGTVRELYLHNNVDLTFLGDYDSFLDEFFSDSSSRLDSDLFIEDAAEAFGSWSCFKQNRPKPNYRELEKRLKKLERSLTPNKVGRNDPCPCGSGKKYKKCCLDKDEARAPGDASLNTDRNEARLLAEYPRVNEASGNLPSFTDMYSSKAVEIDIPVYKALHHRAIPIWVTRNMHVENMENIGYLTDAYRKFVSLCSAENILSCREFDEKYMVHYFSQKWMESFLDIMNEVVEKPTPFPESFYTLHNEVLHTLETMSYKP